MLSSIPFSAYEGLVFLALGAAAGFLGGLIGIGGGFVLVPGLYYVFSQLPGFAEMAMPLTLGTTMACIIFTATSSSLAHLRRGAVELSVVRNFAPFVAPATALGSVLATVLKVYFLKFAFAAFCLYSAARMLFFSQSIARPGANLNDTRYWAFGGFFGTVCGLLGVGGANLFVPFLMKRHVDPRRAMATASALQLPIAAAGTAAFVLSGLGQGLPVGSLGYVYTPALALLVTGSMLLAPLGVKATHALPVPVVKKMFAVFTALVGFKMLFSA